MPITSTTTINVFLECDECGEQADSSFNSENYDEISAEDAQDEALTENGWGTDFETLPPRTLCGACLAEVEGLAEATS